MKDRKFLAWLHSRLEKVHKEDTNLDYMSKLRSIMSVIDPEQETPNTGGSIYVLRELGFIDDSGGSG